jgi:DUF2075 family protein
LEGGGTPHSSALLGVIKNITNWFSVKDLLVYDDCVVLAKGSLANVAFQATGAQFGAVGAVAGRALGTRADASRIGKAAGMSPDEVAKRNKKNQLIRNDQIVSAELKKKLTSSRLSLLLADGRRYKLQWMNDKNKFPEVQSLLQQSLGTKLQT